MKNQKKERNLQILFSFVIKKKQEKKVFVDLLK